MGRETSSLSNADRSVTPQLITYLQAYYDYRKPSFLVRCCGHWLGARWFRFISNRHYCFLCTIFIDISHVLFEYRLVIRRYYRYCCWKLICIAWMWDMTYSINFVDTFQNYTYLLQCSLHVCRGSVVFASSFSVSWVLWNRFTCYWPHHKSHTAFNKWIITKNLHWS